MTNRALVLSALADGPSTITNALASRDTDLMVAALRSLGIGIVADPADPTQLTVTPGRLHGGRIDCGLAGTVMRFVPPLAAACGLDVTFDGDEQARTRPMAALVDGLGQLGVEVSSDRLPLSVTPPAGGARGGKVAIDASQSSQFVSGLLLSGARFAGGLHLTDTSGKLVSRPHIDMTIQMLAQASVTVREPSPGHWIVDEQPVKATHWIIEPDLSNATVFYAAAIATGGSVTIPGWPTTTTQPGASFIDIARAMGATATRTTVGGVSSCTVTGPALRPHGIDVDLHDVGELAPTIAALAALADGPSRLRGIGHLRGHETDRLAALSREITGLGGRCTQTDDGLVIEPRPLNGGVWHSYADHRMATAGAIIALVTDGVSVENLETTSKTMPEFYRYWSDMLNQDKRS